jgi:hypothetical protein
MIPVNMQQPHSCRSGQARHGAYWDALRQQAAMFQKLQVRMPKRGCVVVEKAARASGMI